MCTAGKGVSIVQFCENGSHFMNCSETSPLSSGLLSMKPLLPEISSERETRKPQKGNEGHKITESTPRLQQLRPFNCVFSWWSAFMLPGWFALNILLFKFKSQVKSKVILDRAELKGCTDYPLLLHCFCYFESPALSISPPRMSCPMGCIFKNRQGIHNTEGGSVHRLQLHRWRIIQWLTPPG